MDPTRFDALARTLVAAATRRRVVGLLLGAGFAGFDRAALAKKTRKRKSKKDNASARRRRTGKDRKGNARKTQTPRAEANKCCSTGACTPGKGKNLAKCCLQGQNLTGKNLSGANLGSANLSRATLTGANLQGANLGNACLVDAYLRGLKQNNSTNWAGAIQCRTQTDSGENNAGCAKGTPCCPTCDNAHPCDDGEVCCNGRCLAGNCCDNGEQSTCDDGELCCANTCVAGDCCATADCPNETCQRRSCQDHTCVYEPVFGRTGPRCQTICCEDGQGEPACCDAGVAICQASGVCGCGGDEDCGQDEKCCAGTCVPRTLCCEGNNAEGCAGDLHCCVVGGNGVCRACCTADQCPDETCETKSCGSDGTCAYTPILGDDGPGCATVCCENADEQPVCCPDGTTVCQGNGRCGCQGNQDCAAGEICCNEICIANTRCCNNNPSTCPAPGICQQRACTAGECQPQGVTGGTCPFASGGTGQCSNGSCICPSPRITCSNGCCDEGTTQCALDGACPRPCEVCPIGCPFTTVAAAVAGTPAGGTIRICPGNYPTLDVTVNKNLTIIGMTSDGSRPLLDGQRTNRIFTIADGVTATLRDLIVTRGQGTQQDNTGASIRVLFDADLTLERVEVSDSTNPSGFGLGAIYVAPRSSLLLKESRVVANRNFSFGGGINVANGATVTLAASIIDQNSAGLGGGIWIDDSGTVNLDDDSIVAGNHAQNPSPGAGGGIFNKGTVNGATTRNVIGNTRGNPPVPDNCANALRIPGSGSGTGCPA